MARAIDVVLGQMAYEQLASGRGSTSIRQPYEQVLQQLKRDCNAGYLDDGNRLYVDKLSDGYFPLIPSKRIMTDYFAKNWLSSIFRPRGDRVQIHWHEMRDEDLVDKFGNSIAASKG